MTYRDLINMKDNEGLTLNNYQSVNYNEGYQVATEGYETRNSQKALKYIKELKGTCGLWKSNGVYYVDKSHNEKELNKALEIGRQCNQISIFDWANRGLIYC